LRALIRFKAEALRADVREGEGDEAEPSKPAEAPPWGQIATSRVDNHDHHDQEHQVHIRCHNGLVHLFHFPHRDDTDADD